LAAVSGKVREQYAATFGNRMWRLCNLYWITDETGKKILFYPNDEQMDFLENRHDFNCILKARRLGFSTVIQLDGLDDCVFNSNIEFGVIAQSLDDAKAIFRSKIKFAYDRLPEQIRAAVTATTDSANEIRFSNGSGIRVGTSLRGGTLQRLHISEYGKISAKFPDKAVEIKTGAFNTVHAGQLIDVESTAEGIGGEFYDLCRHSEKLQQEGAVLTSLDPKFHFYPWWMKTSHRLPKHGVNIPLELKSYFKRLKEDHGIALDAEQQAWYVKKSQQMGSEMKREFPSTAAEPFEVAVDGAYFGSQMARVRKEGRICKIPVVTSVPINTYWDLGRNDNTAIWLHQHVGKEDRFVGYYQNAGESLAHYVKWLKEWLPDDCIWGEHYLPHDAKVVELTRRDNKSREEVIQDLGLRSTRVVERVQDLQTGIEMSRQVLATSWFDKDGTAEGIQCLDNYRKAWNETQAVWRNEPAKSRWNHGADAYRQFAQGFKDDGGWSNPEDDDISDDWVL
jgi:hypothetical protein